MLGLGACLPISNDPKPGPDKQSIGTWYGAALGATGGAATGANLGVGTGPGALAGAGFGAIFGMLHGLGVDNLEEEQISRQEEAVRLKELSWAHEVLASQYQRRLELHPSREIYPADLFFADDEVSLRDGADTLLGVLARLTRERKPWAKIVIASYVKGHEEYEDFAVKMARKRADEIATEFVRSGVEPRRIGTKASALRDPILVDPADSPGRYNQAIEIILLD